MDYTFYLKTLWCKVFLKPDSTFFNKFPRVKIFKENNRSLISGYFTDVKVVGEFKESYYGSQVKFFFVDKPDIEDFEKSTDKKKYICEIDYSDIISIEMMFDEFEYKKQV